MTHLSPNYLSYDIVIIGGGFYGCRLALLARKFFKRVLLVEKESELMQRASFVNQARIHNGYHYPRSLLTALRSRVNFPKFLEDYQGSVVNNFKKIYAIAKHGSKVNAKAFEQFCNRIGASVEEAPANISNLFHSNFIEKTFLVTEYAFDSKKLKNLIQDEMRRNNVELLLSTKVHSIQDSQKNVAVNLQNGHYQKELTASLVFNCTYSQINTLLSDSNKPTIPLKHEITEIPLVQVSPPLQGLGITVMDGSFFSLMPFPSKNLYSFSHVRYTPHLFWHDGKDESFNYSEEIFKNFKKKSHFYHILKDAQRFIPEIKNCQYKESIWEVKTVLPRSESDDSRPILCSRNPSIKNIVNIMGGKIDNIYDIEEYVKKILIEYR